MNDYDFQQSGDFLDSLFNPNYTSDVSDLPTTDSLVTSTTTATTEQPIPSTSTYTPYSTSGLTTTGYYIPSGMGLQSADPETKPSLSFPPNFYKEINYADDPPSDIKQEIKEEVNTEEANGLAGGADSCVEQYEEQPPDIDIKINNVVSSFAVKCHINLRKVATEGAHVIYKRENGVSLWNSSLWYSRYCPEFTLKYLY